MEKHFNHLLGNPSKVIDKLFTKIINSQLDIKLGQFTQEELNVVLTKIKIRKSAGLDTIFEQKTMKFDDFIHFATPDINRIQYSYPKIGNLGITKKY